MCIQASLPTKSRLGQQTTNSEIQIDGNNTLEYANLNYQGLEYPQTDVSAMEYVHLDYYTDDATALDFYLISKSPTVENAYSFSIVTWRLAKY